MEKIPIEVLYAQAMKENKRLEKENYRYAAKIKEFKEWQRLVPKREISFWIKEFILTLHENDELIEKLQNAKKLYELDKAFKKDFEKFAKNLRDRSLMHKSTRDISRELCALTNDGELISLLVQLSSKLANYEKFREKFLEDFPEFLDKEEAN